MELCRRLFEKTKAVSEDLVISVLLRNTSGVAPAVKPSTPIDGLTVRVSKIIDVESVAKIDGIIGCDRPSRVDWGVPIGREVVEVYGAPQTTTWKEKKCLGTLATGCKNQRPDRSVPSLSLRGNGNAPQFSCSEVQ